MKKIEINLYSFDELSEQAQQEVLRSMYDINVSDRKWWDAVYEDASEVGLTIKGFDIDRGNYVELCFTVDPETTAHKIVVNHGDHCGTYKAAQAFLNDIEADARDLDLYEREFLRKLQSEYLHLLKGEYEYLTSDEAIKETIIANEYYFTETGKLY